jgi:hypothetical protein
LRAVLKLDECTPLIDFGDDDTFKLTDDGAIICTPGWPPPPKSLKHRARTGEALARILEHQLMSILSFGEGVLCTTRKVRRGDKELGGRRFVKVLSSRKTS